jgi:hypothetical protein
MATFDEDMRKYQRPGDMSASAPSMAAQQTARRMNPNPTAGMSGTSAVNEQLARMQPKHMQESRNRVFERSVADSAELRAQAAQQIVMRDSMQLGGSPDYSINVENGNGVALDDQFVNDQKYYSPEVRELMSEARRMSREETANLFAGANTSAWKSTKDMKNAVNQLSSVKRFGPLIESWVQGLVRNHVDPAMKARFEAGDRTRQSFVEWAERSAGLFATPDAYDNDPALRRQFEDDPNAQKFDAIDGKVVPRQLTPEQDTATRIGLQTGAQEASIAAAKQRYDAADPAFKAANEFNPITGQVAPRQQIATPEVIDAQVTEFNKAQEQAGTQQRAMRVPDLKNPGQFTTATFQMPPKSSYENVGNDLFRRVAPEQQDRIVQSILEAEAMAEEMTQRGPDGQPLPSLPGQENQTMLRAKAAAKVARKRFGLENVDLFTGQEQNEFVDVPTPKGQGEKLGEEAARKILEAAGGDANKAREMAKAAGWSF